ncbi:MAG: GNAT family N-acetyltransferase [Clostridiales bacterium]|nr:GNAT family N-acetyltransferase [Clostridiales bacterium]
MIKPYMSTDMESCVRVMIEAYNGPPWNDHWMMETATRYLKEFEESPRFFGFTLWEGGALIGAAFCREKTWWNKDEIKVEELFIAPQYQRQGYGKQLLQAIEAYIKEHSLAGFTLLTNRYMPALDFYKKNDFAPADHVVFMYKVIK